MTARTRSLHAVKHHKKLSAEDYLKVLESVDLSIYKNADILKKANHQMVINEIKNYRLQRAQ